MDRPIWQPYGTLTFYVLFLYMKIMAQPAAAT